MIDTSKLSDKQRAVHYWIQAQWPGLQAAADAAIDAGSQRMLFVALRRLDCVQAMAGLSKLTYPGLDAAARQVRDAIAGARGNEVAAGIIAGPTETGPR